MDAGSITNSYAAGSLTVPNDSTVTVAGGLVGLNENDGYDSITNSFSSDNLSSSMALGGGGFPVGITLGGLVGADQDSPSLLNSTDYFDATAAGTMACTGDTTDSCSIVNTTGSQSTYFDNNSTNPPLNTWNFSTIWYTTTGLPILVPQSNVTPVTPSINPNPGAVKPLPIPFPKPSPTPTPTPSPTPDHGTVLTPFVANSGGGGGILGTISGAVGAVGKVLGHFIAHLPVAVVVGFPYALFILLLLGALAALIELGRELRRLRLVQALLVRQKVLAEERDTFWHLAANYLRAPVTLVVGGAEALAEQHKTTIIAKINKIAQDLQFKVAAIMQQAEDSHSLQAITRPPESKVHQRILTKTRFWVPVLGVASLAIVSDLVATNFRHISTGLVAYATQVMVFVLGVVALYWMLSLLQAGKQHRKQAENLLRRQEDQLEVARNAFVTETASNLNEGVTELEVLLPKLAKGSDGLATITEGTTRLRQMITTFGLLVQIQGTPGTLKAGGKATANSVGLAGLLTRAVAASKATIVARDLQVVYPTQTDIQLPGTSQLLGQVVSSVVANAIEFSPQGGVVSISATKTPEEITLRVVDQGEGITKDQLPHLFQPFARADGKDALKLDHGGLGLNLYLDKLIMEQLAGSITTASEVGRGSTFTLTWPTTGVKEARSTHSSKVAVVYSQDYRSSKE